MTVSAISVWPIDQVQCELDMKVAPNAAHLSARFLWQQSLGSSITTVKWDSMRKTVEETEKKELDNYRNGYWVFSFCKLFLLSLSKWVFNIVKCIEGCMLNCCCYATRTAANGKQSFNYVFFCFLDPAPTLYNVWQGQKKKERKRKNVSQTKL